MASSLEQQRAAAKIRRAYNRANGMCVNSPIGIAARPHPKPTSGVRCDACKLVHRESYKRPPGECRGCRGATGLDRKFCVACTEKRTERRRARNAALRVNLYSHPVYRSRRGNRKFTDVTAWLENPLTRILRALRRFDWVGSHRIAMAIDVPAFADDRRARNAFHSNLRRLVRNGFVLQRQCGQREFEYRLAEPRLAEMPTELVEAIGVAA